MDQSKYSYLINSHANAESTKLLTSLEFKVKNNGSVICACPIHGGDNPLGFSYDNRRKVWSCWTHNCHEKYGRDLIGLVRGIKGVPFEEACKYIINVLKIKIDAVGDDDLERKMFIDRQSQKRLNTSSWGFYDNKILTGLDHNVEFFSKRGFNYETLKTFQAFFCSDNKKPFYGRACFPIRDWEEKIVGFTGRKTEIINYHDVKWLHFPKEIKISTQLFGIDKSKNYIKDSGVAIVVEGPLDLLRLWEAGIHNVVATFSNKISNDQIKLLKKFGCKTIIIMYDLDEGGEKGRENIINKCRLFFNVMDFRPKLQTDPGKSTVEFLQTNIAPQIIQIIKEQELKYG